MKAWWSSLEMPPLARLTYLIAAIVLALGAIVLVFRWRRKKKVGIGAVLLATLGVAPLVYHGLVHAQLVRETYVRFNQPTALLVTGLGVLLVIWRLSRISQRMAKFRRALLLMFSGFAMILATLAAADPELGRPLDRMTILLLLDRSRSIDLVPGAEQRIAAELKVAERGMHDDDRIGTVVFGANAVTEDPPRPKSDLPPPQKLEVGRDGTDIEAAIRRALAELPSDTAARLVLVSDGVQTRGDSLAAAAAAVAADVPIDVIPLDQKTFPDVRIVSVRAPTRADEGEPIDLRVVTQSASATDVEVRIKRDGTLLHSATVHIGEGEDVLRLREIASEAGLHRYDVEVTAKDPSVDGSPEDNTGATFVRVRGPALALVLEGDPGRAAPMQAALEASGFKVATAGPTGVPSDIGGLAGYDLVILSDVRATDLATIQHEALASYARDLGGGLILMGGDRSMGPGGYARTPIEDVSPVAFDLKEEKRRASLAEVIIIDYSGSMGMMVGGQTKLALANEAAARSASLLGAGDRLGVVHVDTVASWTIPVAPVTDPVAIGARIRAVGMGGGGIYTDLSLKEAYAALDREAVNLKHTLLFADGADAEQITGCRALVANALARGITTSVISLGRGSDTPELEVLSKTGNGRFYLVEDATKLPAVFSQETILASRSSIKEEVFKVSLAAPMPPTRSVDWAGAPQLKGYVVTVPKSRATMGLLGPEGDPILATWAVGIGKSAAFTSDFKDRWGSNWMKWPGAVKMFGQLGRDTARKGDDPRVRLESDASGGELHIRADVIGDDGRAQTFRRLRVHVAGPDGFARDVSLEAVGAGRYAATVPLSRPGTYVATARDELTNEAVGTTGAVLSAGEELRPTGSDRILLTRLADMSGGKQRDTLAGLFDDRAARRFAYSSITAPLALAAAIAMLLGVGSRRLGMPEWLTRMFGKARERAARTEAEQRAALAFAEMRAREQTKTAHGLLAKKQASAAATGARPAASILSQSAQGPVAIGRPKPPEPPGTAPQAGPPAIGPPIARPARQISAAERLAQKRREKK